MVKVFFIIKKISLTFFLVIEMHSIICNNGKSKKYFLFFILFHCVLNLFWNWAWKTILHNLLKPWIIYGFVFGYLKTNYTISAMEHMLSASKKYYELIFMKCFLYKFSFKPLSCYLKPYERI